MFLIFDTETTGLPKRWNAPLSDADNWPRCIQIAWQLHDKNGVLVEHEDYLIQPEGFNVPFDAEKIHGISTELASKSGISMKAVIDRFLKALSKTKFIVGQNLGFDKNIMGAEFLRLGMENPLPNYRVLDTCTETTAQLCQLPGGRGGKFKLPTLSELHSFLFNHPFSEAHNATADVEATTRCFLELIRRKIYTPDELEVDSDYFESFNKLNPEPFKLIGLKHINLKKASEKIRKEIASISNKEALSSETIEKNIAGLEEVSFAHLHNHSQFSILQSTSSTQNLIRATADNNMPAVALTDSGNMMGAFHFVMQVNNYNKTLSEEDSSKK